MTSKSAAEVEHGGWKQTRREAARAAVVAAAWDAVREEGLAGLSIRDLARRAGISTPTVYAYFDSKHAIFDAMFAQGTEEFREWMAVPFTADDPVGQLAEEIRRFAAFCTADVARYQLLFQRTIPGFEPSEDTWAFARETFAEMVERLRTIGVSDPRHVDVWTAINTGLVDQQISNDPGGDRWTRLADDIASMFLTHCLHDTPSPARPRRATPAKKGARP